MLTFVFQVSVPIFVLLKCIIVLFESFAKLQNAVIINMSPRHSIAIETLSSTEPLLYIESLGLA